jgi:hypothetical protein
MDNRQQIGAKQMQIEEIAVKDIKPYERNAKKHDDRQVKNVMESIKAFGFAQPLVIDKDNVLIIGHCRLIAAKRLKMSKVPCVRMENLSDNDVARLRLLDNKLNESEWDFDLLSEDVPTLDFSDFDIDWNLPELDEGDDSTDHGSLADKFIVPPFDIFDGRQGYWLDRKRKWNEKIGDLGQARSDAKAYSIETMKSGTSILDPVLSEVILKWFTPNDTSFCFDCFAGDTVFGFVAGTLGHTFMGIELRQEQVDFNNERTDGMDCVYICDDWRNVAKHIEGGSQDLLFSCPPYYDLEVYSENPNDASNQQTYKEFYQILDDAFTDAIKCLKENRFAVIVVGDIRDKKGAYYNFPNDIIQTFTRNGMVLYNNIKLLTPLGTAQIRASKYMKSRKVAHVYQDVLVFYKGDIAKIKTEFKEIGADYDGEDMEF